MLKHERVKCFRSERTTRDEIDKKRQSDIFDVHNIESRRKMKCEKQECWIMLNSMEPCTLIDHAFLEKLLLIVALSSLVELSNIEGLQTSSGFPTLVRAYGGSEEHMLCMAKF